MDSGRFPTLRRVVPSLALLALPLTSCADDGPSPDAAASAVAVAFAAGDWSDVPLVGSAGKTQAAFDEIVAGMGSATRAVEVVGIDDSVDDEATDASVRLDVVWDLDGPGPLDHQWTYRTDAPLILDESVEPATWRAVWEPALVNPDLVEGDVLVSDRVQPPRADITGADGAVLVTERPVERVGVDKARLAGADERDSARSIARLVDIDPGPYADEVAGAGEQAFVEAIVLREGDAAGLREDVEAVPGGRMISDRLSLAPSRGFARPLLGVVGDATADVVEASGGAVVAGDVVGLSGLQQRYDERLRGEPGFVVRLVPGASGAAASEELYASDARSGDAVELTLDPGVQRTAEAVLADVGPASALVAVRPSDGALLAVASGAGADGYSTATLGQYAPGSVFKVVTTLALLRAGMTPESSVTCPELTTVNGKEFRNYSGYPASALGEIPLRRAFAESCNTAFVTQSDRISPAQLTESAESLGLTAADDFGMDMFEGSVPRAQDPVEHAAAMIGQGPVLASPTLVAVMGAASAGGEIAPRLVVDPQGDEEALPRPVTRREADALRAMMLDTVTSGTAEVLRPVPGPPVGAKTGTAEFGTATPPDTHAWLVAVQGDLAAAVFVEEGQSGSTTAGPLLADFLARMQRQGS